MAKRTAKETLQALREQEIDDEIERLSALSPAQIEEELRRAGVNVDADRAKGLALLESLSSGSAMATPDGQSEAAPVPPASNAVETSHKSGTVPVSPDKKRRGAWGLAWQLGGAAAVLAVVGSLGPVAYYAMTRDTRAPVDVVSGRHAPKPPPVEIAGRQPVIVPNRPGAPPPDEGERATAPATATELRRAAFTACSRHEWSACLEDLDAAKEHDPAGDASPDVQHWRRLIAGHSESPVQLE